MSGYIGRVSYDEAANADRNVVVNDIPKFGITEEVADAQSADADYPIDMQGRSELSIEFTLTGTATLTVYGTLQDDGTEPGSTSPKDVTNAIYGVASLTATGLLLDANRVAGQFKYLTAKITGTSGATYTILARKK